MQQSQTMYGNTQPKRLTLFLHLRKTFKLIGALITDRRIPVWRKLVFAATIAFLLVLLLFPDILNETLLSIAMPIVGTVTGIPIDAGFDWTAFAIVLVNLLKFFPPTLVAEHYQNIFL
ncbi:MAG TPA: hypothetical protein VKR42_06285 [Ktedonobacteraceae bacterium]|nr:hypothetical protein [Ktedonobacteraceae bacterium]